MLCRVRSKNSAEHFAPYRIGDATCKPLVPFDGNEQLAKVGCYHFAVNWGLEFQKDVISLRYFAPEYHNFLIPTRQMNLVSEHFCLVDLISFDMV